MLKTGPFVKLLNNNNNIFTNFISHSLKGHFPPQSQTPEASVPHSLSKSYTPDPPLEQLLRVFRSLFSFLSYLQGSSVLANISLSANISSTSAAASTNSLFVEAAFLSYLLRRRFLAIC